MTTEEKARAYDEALEKVKPLHEQAKEDNCPIWSTYEYLFPQLAESKDERIRKWIKKEIEDKYVVEGIVNNKLADEAFGWLEKQKHLYETTKDRFYREGFEEGQLYEKQKEQKDYNKLYEDIAQSEWFKKAYEGKPLGDDNEQEEQKVDIDKEKLIRHCIGLILTDATDERFKDYGLTLKDCLTWLGEQEEQKPFSTEETELNSIAFLEQMGYTCIPPEAKTTEWSKEDREIIQSIITNGCVDDKQERWLRMLPERIYQPKQEWNEEDEELCQKTIEWFEEKCFPYALDDNNPAKDCIVWLKSLRPQPHTVSVKNATKFGNLEYERGVKDGIQSAKSRQWKPSKEQIGALNYAYCELFKREDVGHNILGPLQKLCDELKKR